MEWLKNYFFVTLLFWKDNNKVTLEQFAFLPALYGGVLYAAYTKVLGTTQPTYILKDYLFPVISFVILVCYIGAGIKAKYAVFVAKLLRVSLLQLFLSLLFFISITPWIPDMSNSSLLKVGIGISLLVLTINTQRHHKIFNKFLIADIILMLQILSCIAFLSVMSWYFSYYFVLPKQ